MNRHAARWLVFILAAGLMLPGPGMGKTQKILPLQQPAGQPGVSLVYDAQHALEKAFVYLSGQQAPNGSWKNDPAITALVLYAFVLPPSYSPGPTGGEALARGYGFLEKFVKPDGGIYHEKYKNYTTAVALMALAELNSPRYAGTITAAKKFLIGFQVDESEGVDRANPYYGGIGYGGDDRPDLSNTQLALEAIRAAESYEDRFRQLLPADAAQVEKEQRELGLHWHKALVFLARCQNLKAVNDMPYATDDGGFIYETGHYKPDRSHSYGSMTYAGAKSLLYAQVAPEDLRLKKALQWIYNNYTLEENPGFGTTSLYYYYMTAAKCLAVVGQDVFVDGKGLSRPWRSEMLEKLVSLQHEEGYWVNANGRYWENIKDLATAYAVIAMKHALVGKVQ